MFGLKPPAAVILRVNEARRLLFKAQVNDLDEFKLPVCI